jgi:hypothetical protein
MKIISSAVLVALFAVSQGRFLDATNSVVAPSTIYGSTYANNLNCGQCIGQGHTYCVNQAEGVMNTNYQTGSTTQKCIQAGTSAGEMTNTAWSCSNAFADRVYSKYVCQYNTAACGSSPVVALATTNSTANVNITNLALGQTCFYRVAAGCGGPSFKPNDTSKVEIEFVEFRDTNLNSSDVIRGLVLGSNHTDKRGSVPATGMPRRDHFFQASLGGNQIPNTNQTSYNASTNGTVWGRSGRYDKVAGGRKAYGNPTQGDSQMANSTSSSDPECSLRSLYVAVTATTDLATLRVDFSSLKFYTAPTATPSGANMLSITFAAVLGLLSLAFF